MDRAHLGDLGELWFAAALPAGWVWQPPRRDFGKDGLIVIRDGSELHNLEFSVQIKTSARPRVRDHEILLSGISRSSVRYWFASPLPTLVVAVDIHTREAWYEWHLNLFDSPAELFESTSATMTIRIPTANRLNDDGWKLIRVGLRNHFKALQRALWADNVVPRLLQTVYNVSRITGNLIRLGSTAPPEPPLTKSEGISLLIEQIEVRELIECIRSFVSKIGRGDVRKQLTFWLTSFEEAAKTAHPSVLSLPPRDQNIPPDFELAFAPKGLLATRPQLVLAAVDLMRLLTSPSPRARSSDEESAYAQRSGS